MAENYLSFGVPTPCLPSRWVFKCFFITKATLKKKKSSYTTKTLLFARNMKYEQNCLKQTCIYNDIHEHENVYYNGTKC